MPEGAAFDGASTSPNKWDNVESSGIPLSAEASHLFYTSQVISQKSD